MKTVLLLFGWALKCAIGEKTDQGINCLSPESLNFLTYMHFILKLSLFSSELFFQYHFTARTHYCTYWSLSGKCNKTSHMLHIQPQAGFIQWTTVFMEGGHNIRAVSREKIPIMASHCHTKRRYDTGLKRNQQKNNNKTKPFFFFQI